MVVFWLFKICVDQLHLKKLDICGSLHCGFNRNLCTYIDPDLTGQNTVSRFMIPTTLCEFGKQDTLWAGVVDDDTVTEKMVKAGVGGVRTIKEGIVLAGVSMWV